MFQKGEQYSTGFSIHTFLAQGRAVSTLCLLLPDSCPCTSTVCKQWRTNTLTLLWSHTHTDFCSTSYKPAVNAAPNHFSMFYCELLRFDEFSSLLFLLHHSFPEPPPIFLSKCTTLLLQIVYNYTIFIFISVLFMLQRLVWLMSKGHTTITPNWRLGQSWENINLQDHTVIEG